MQQVTPVAIPMVAGFHWPRTGDRREYLRARLERDEAGDTVVIVYPNQSSGVLVSTAWAEGFVIVPESTVVHPGDTVSYVPFAEFLR